MKQAIFCPNTHIFCPFTPQGEISRFCMSLTLTKLEKRRNLQPFGFWAAKKAVFCSREENFSENPLHFQQETKTAQRSWLN